MSDRFTGAIDVYQKKTRDLLMTVPVTQPAVVSTQIQNVGSVRNRGLEATVDARLFDGSNSSATSGLVLSVDRNSVLSLGDAPYISTGDVFNNTALVYGTKGNAKSSRNFLASALADPTGINEPAIFSSRWIENGRFIRLQNMTVGYTFQLPLIGGEGRTARVYLSGDNLLLFTPYSGYDPEVFVDASVDGAATRGIDYLTYPRARTFTVGAHVGF
jgi:iron complex outermembrane receptor protein